MMKDNDLLMIVLAFFLGFCFRKMMGGQLIEGSEDYYSGYTDSGTAQAGERCIKDYDNFMTKEQNRYSNEYKCKPIYQHETKYVSKRFEDGGWQTGPIECCAKYSGDGGCNTDGNLLTTCIDGSDTCFEGNTNPYYIGTCDKAIKPCRNGLPACDSIKDIQYG